MKKSKIVIIFLIAVVFIMVVSICAKKGNKLNEQKCTMFSGGSYDLIFETNGGTKIDSLSVCIACSPDSYVDIPTTEKKGYTFDGWYFDKELTKKVETKSTLDITPIQNKDKNDCLTGYKDITLYAKWLKK